MREQPNPLGQPPLGPAETEHETTSDQPIPFGRPMLGPAETEAVSRVLQGPQLVHGPIARALETQFAERVGTQYAVTVSSCTAALHLTLLARGIGPGDVVAVPAMTHVATAHAVEFCGARPVFVDADPKNGNLDIEDLARIARGGLAAVIVVHYLGLPCEMGPIQAIADAAGAWVLEDCALAVGATYRGRQAGSLGRAGCFSFYPTKHITTVEGGMVTTDDAALAQAVAQRKAFGYDRPLGQRKRPGVYDVEVLGYNYRMSEVHAAVGLAQLERLDGFLTRRAHNFETLRSIVSTIDDIRVFEPRQGDAHSSHYCLNAVLPQDGHIQREQVVASLQRQGIGTSVHYPRPVPFMRYYRKKYGDRLGYTPVCFPVARWLADQTISLPVGPHLGPDDAKRIGHAFKAAIHQARAAGQVRHPGSAALGH